MTVTLGAIRECLDGLTPAILATCSRAGVPNVTYLSQAFYLDDQHIALSFQFFNKTRQNVLENPRARLMVWHPITAAMYRVDVRYLRTETSGATYERMRAMLAGIASHTGMAGVFKLQGADIYRVLSIEALPSRQVAPDEPRAPRLPGLRAACERLARAVDYAQLLSEALSALGQHLSVTHAMVLAHDGARGALYAVASMGYERSGVGAEIAIGSGVIGVAARERTAIRLTHVTSDRAYLTAVRSSAERQGVKLEQEIAWPGLPSPGSQVAVPLVACDQLLGVLFVESERDGRFAHDDEDALAMFASQLAWAMQALQRVDDDERPQPASPAPALSGKRARVRHYREDDSVFIDDEYVIKGVAGAILWAMVCDHAATGRDSFTNRELRLDPRIKLPEVGDNLEARLVLLQRRLVDRDACIKLVRVGRGRLRLEVARPLEPVEIG